MSIEIKTYGINEWLEFFKQYSYNSLICFNCNRNIPNLNFRRKQGCKWCVPEKPTKYCNGEY